MAINRNRIGDAGLNFESTNTNRTLEYLAELQEREGSVKLRQMSKSDDVVGMILRVHKNPIRSASWDIPYPADVTDKEKEAIDLIKKVLFGNSGTEFDTLLGKILSMMEYGFSLFEQYYIPMTFNGSVYLVPRIEQRMQTSIQDIFPQQNKVVQLKADGGQVSIPFENLIFFILNQQGEDMRGESLLRNAYGAYKDKRIYREWLGIGIQRSVSGIPSVKVPKGCQINSDDYAAVEQLLQKITQHENAYMILKEGFEFEVHESKFNAEQVQKAIDARNSGMALSVLAQFVMLGQLGSGGAYALSRDQSDFFLDGLQYIVNLVCGTINSRVIEPFLKINFGDSINPSRVVLYGMNINKKAGLELSQVLNTLGQAGFIKPTLNDEVQLRSNLDMPELSDEELENRKKEPLKPIPQQKPVLFAEKKSDRREYIENTEKEVLDFMRGNLLLIKDKLIADIESVMNRGSVEIQGLKGIEVSYGKYLKGLQMKLGGIANDSWNRAKKSAKMNAVKFSEVNPNDLTDKVLKQFVLNQADSITSKQIEALRNRAILTAQNSSLKGLSIAQSISNTSKAIDDYIQSSGVQVDGSLVVVGTSNFGEMQFYKEIKDQLWGYRFVGIDDSVQSDICRWYNGKTFSIDSPELAEATAPLHPNCRSYMEPIYKSEEEPMIDDVIPPPSIREGKVFY